MGADALGRCPELRHRGCREVWRLRGVKPVAFHIKGSVQPDLPKGHVDPGESPADCALRELHEETGIVRQDISIDDRFEFRTRYAVLDRMEPRELAEKTLVIYLAWLERPVEIQVSEHGSHRWFDWNPPHQIQQQTIDPLLAYAETFLA